MGKNELENAGKIKLTGFCSLVLKVTSHHLCSVLFVRGRLQGPVCTQGEGITGDCTEGLLSLTPILRMRKLRCREKKTEVIDDVYICIDEKSCV